MQWIHIILLHPFARLIPYVVLKHNNKILTCFLKRVVRRLSGLKTTHFKNANVLKILCSMLSIDILLMDPLFLFGLPI